MTALKGKQIDGFLAKPDPRTPVVLVYGPDRGSVSERTRNLITLLAGTIDDPFTVARLDDAALGEDPARLDDEARAIPMMGGVRVVWIESAGANAARMVETYLKDPAPDAWVVAEAGALAPSAKLRQVFEKAKNAAALPCYQDTARSLDELIDEELGAGNLTISPEARHRLIAVLGADRGLSRTELQKLCLYCHGQDEVTVDDVDMACGDVSALVLDDLVDHTFEGDIARADHDYARLLAAGTAYQAIIAGFFNHISRLRTVRSGLDARKSLDTAVASLRPPLHFSRKASVRKQVDLWSQTDLDRAASATAEAEYGTRGSDGLSDAILGRHVLTLANAARQKARR